MEVLTAFLALLSCTLIGTGIWLVLRDTRRTNASRAAEAKGMLVTRVETDPKHLPAHEDPDPAAIDAPPATVQPNAGTHTRLPQPMPPERLPEPVAVPGNGGPSSATGDWSKSFDASTRAALRAVNGAFEPAGVKLVQDASIVSPDGAAPVVAVSLMARHHRAGTLYISASATEVEITAQSLPAGLDEVRRERRLMKADAHIPALAEAIAACAWPVITASTSRQFTRR